MSRKLGRAEVRRGRIGRKAHRHIERNSLSVIGDRVVVLNRSQRVDGRIVRREFVGREYAQQVRENMGIVGRDWIRPVSIGFVREFVPVRLRDEVSESYAAKSFLVVRLKPDEQLRFGDRRRKLEGMAAKYKFGCTSVYGPIAFVDDERGVVDIKLRGTDFENLADMLVKQRWLQSTTDPRMFSKVSSSQSREFAVKFCEHHAGEWFALRGAIDPIVDYLFRAEWLEVLENTRALPGNGTTEHLLAAHPFRKHKAKTRGDGIPAAEVAASRKNGNGVKYIPRIAPKMPRTPSVPAMHAAGHYVQFGG